MKKSCARVAVPSFVLLLAVGMTACKVKPVEINSGVNKKGSVSPRPMIKQLALGDQHTCALIDDGVWCWGHNSKKQLGNPLTEISTGREEFSAQPVKVFGLEHHVTAIAAKGDQTCAIVDGDLACWGEVFGVQGEDSLILERPQYVGRFERLARTVAVGKEHVCVEFGADSKIQCFGKNGYGQLGINQDQTYSERFQDVLTTPNVDSGLHSSLIVAGKWSTCARDRQGSGDDRLKCWGKMFNSNALDRPENNFRYNLATDIPNMDGRIDRIAVGVNHICVVSNGLLKCFGDNAERQLGVDRNSQEMTVRNLSLVTDVQQITAGDFFTCAVHEGAVKCWGKNDKGQLGAGEKSDQPQAIPSTIRAFEGEIVNLSAGANHVCASDQHTIKCWGSNSRGQLGIERTLTGLTSTDPTTPASGADPLEGAYSASPVEVQF